MPELPEVSNVVNYLEPLLTNKKIIACSVHSDNPRIAEERYFIPFLHQPIDSVQRIGKNILLLTPVGVIRVHLGMSGKILIASHAAQEKHVHWSLTPEQGEKIIFADARRFGKVEVYSSLDEFRKKIKIGVDPINDSIKKTLEDYLVRHPYRDIRSILFDQSVVCGLGNIYVNEVLFEMGIHPETRARDITSLERERLSGAIIKILQDAIKQGGTTFRDFQHPDNKAGQNLNFLKVYGKEGEICPRCQQSRIIRLVYLSRGTFVCPSCQPRRS